MFFRGLWTSPTNKGGLYAAGPLGLFHSLVTVFLRVSQQIQERERGNAEHILAELGAVNANTIFYFGQQ